MSGVVTLGVSSSPRPAATRGGAAPFARLPGPWPASTAIIVAKPGLDGHDRGAKVVARALRDAGFEVIYTGLHQTPEQIAETAIQEDADAVGLSCHSGAHMTLFPRVVAALRERGAGDVLVFGGGIIPADDIPALEAAGIEKVFTPGATTAEIVAWLRDAARRRDTASTWISTSTRARSCSERTGSRPRAGSSPRRGDEAAAARASSAGTSVVKVQVQVGGRGKGGGVVLVDSPERAAEEAAPDARARASRDTRSRGCWSRSCCRSRRSSTRRSCSTGAPATTSRW